MYIPLLSDPQVNSIAIVMVAIVGAIPVVLSAKWSREAKSNSQEAKSNSAQALQEVETNGGMESPLPNLNDHVKYQTQMAEQMLKLVNRMDERFTDHLDDAEDAKKLLTDHIEHSKIMDKALAEVYLKVKPGITIELDD